jgi:hypothetical protein
MLRTVFASKKREDSANCYNKRIQFALCTNINAVMKLRRVILVKHVERFEKMTDIHKN